MTVKRLSKEDIRQSGVLNPVGHTIAAFADDAATERAAAELHAVGFDADDVLIYTSQDSTARLRARIESASSTAGFGYEITLMRRYLALAEAGCGWLIVYAPDDVAADQVLEIAKRLHARCAVRYHRLATEDLI